VCLVGLTTQKQTFLFQRTPKPPQLAVIVLYLSGVPAVISIQSEPTSLNVLSVTCEGVISLNISAIFTSPSNKIICLNIYYHYLGKKITPHRRMIVPAQAYKTQMAFYLVIQGTYPGTALQCRPSLHQPS
jgi:hypothetical protein